MSDKSKTASTQDEVAGHFGIHRRTFNDWLKAGCPGKVNGKFDLEAIEEWRGINRPPVKPKETDAELEYRLKLAEVEKKEAEAVIKHHEMVKKTEDVVHLDDVELYLTQLFTEGRRKLMKLPEVVPMGFDESIRPQIKEELEKQIEVWLKWMANKAASLSDIREL